ncbi:MAG TPA: SEL1-like repeat protein, partial [Terriglobia bacterium]|nr:SEL1-like repeat protein [Terriglobia bacterium]
MGIHISVEVPSEIWPELHGEVEAILSSFEMRPTSGPTVARSSGEPAGVDDKCRGAGAAGCASLAVRLAEGDGVVQDGPRAIELFRRACDGG